MPLLEHINFLNLKRSTSLTSIRLTIISLVSGVCIAILESVPLFSKVELIAIAYLGLAGNSSYGTKSLRRAMSVEYSFMPSLWASGLGCRTVHFTMFVLHVCPP